MFITVDSSITTELKIDQSVAHNGICLTVVELKDTSFSNRNWRNRSKTNLGNWVVGDNLNLERAMKLGDRPTDTWYKVTWTKQEHALKLKKPVVGIILLIR
jgi:riboflavin synthase alpha subunit